MFFVAGDEHNGAAGHCLPFAILVYLALAGMDKNFMFPGMGVAWGEAAWGNSEHPHAEVIGMVILADYYPSGYAFGILVVKMV